MMVDIVALNTHFNGIIETIKELPVNQILTKFADILAFKPAYDLWQIQGGPLNPRGM